MSISALMKTSVSGMDAQSNRLGTVADNIANANTTGYKRAYNEFSSFIPNRSTSEYVSGSVMSDIRTAISEQGNFNYTTSQTDLAVSGNGFFLVSNADGADFLTRAGSFVKTGNGDLVNAAGYYLMGYPYVNGNPTPPVSNGTAGLQRVALGDLVMKAEVSDAGVFYANLPAALPAADPQPSSSLVVYTYLGTQVTMDLKWQKSAAVANEWTLSTSDQGGFGPTTTAILDFDPNTGALTTVTQVPPSASPLSIDIQVPDANVVGTTTHTLTLDLSQSSQLAADYSVIDAHVNGNAPSSVDKVEVAKDGTLYAIYANGARVASYQIPLGTVPSPDNLQSLPGDIFSPNQNSGNLLIGIPGQSGYGTIAASALEQSTVDLAAELSNMIEAQRHYEMNSKVFQTGSAILDVLVNLVR